MIKEYLMESNVRTNNPMYYIEQAKALFKSYLEDMRQEEENATRYRNQLTALKEWDGVIE